MLMMLQRANRMLWIRILPKTLLLSLVVCNVWYVCFSDAKNVSSMHEDTTGNQNTLFSDGAQLISNSASHRKLSAYPSGVQYDYTPNMLETAGCTRCFVSPFKFSFIASHFQTCTGHYLFVGALKAGESTHRLGAFALRSDILKVTTRNQPRLSNGVFWYNTPGYSFGFSGVEGIYQNLADVSDLEDISRLSWFFENGLGGFRAGTHISVYGGSSTGDEWSKQIYSCADYQTSMPVSQPSGQPNRQPLTQPSGQPTRQQNAQPLSQPSVQPMGQPSGQPTVIPLSQPTRQWSSKPSSEPSKHPQSLIPSEASRQPSCRPSTEPYVFSPNLFGATIMPSYAPTTVGFPTSTPTSGLTISIMPPIPKITSIVVIPSSHNVSVTVHLSAVRDSPGAVYCIAMSEGSVPSSTGEVMSGGTAKQYLTSTKSLTIVIPGLLALVSYQIYCYVELSDGSGSNYADVIATSQLFSTSCCHSILFSNAPVSVYGNVSLYMSSSSKSDLSTFVFSYYLESAPSQGSIIVTPTITFENRTTSSGDISVISVPSSAEFRSSYSLSRLKGQFYLSTTSTVSGTFLVSLIVTGQDQSTFTTATTLVHILSVDQPLQAPRLLSSAFDSSGGYFTIKFDRPTDQAGIKADKWSCDDLFTFTGSNTTTCSWTSQSTIKATFADITASTLMPKAVVLVKGNLLRAACRSGTSCADNVGMNSDANSDSLTIVQRPAYPMSPSLLVSIPALLGACNDLFIDLSTSTGSGGRPWSSVAWTALAEIGDTTELTAFLTNNFDHSSNFVTVPRSMLIQTTYSIGVTVTNFLGDSASSSSTVIVSSDPNLPTASILGSLSRTIKASDSLTIPGSAMVSKCGSSYSLGYTWTLTNSSGALLTSKFTSTDPRKYVAPVYSLNAGSFYKVTLNLILLSQNGLPLSSLYTAANIYVKHGNVIAAVRGGYMREVSIDRVLTLDASISSDEDTSTGSEGLLFSWTCTIASLTDFGSSCDFSSMNVATSSSSVFILPANQMVLSTKYIFTVIATSKDGRSASKNVLITALLPGSPVVFSNNTLTKFNLDSVLSIPGTVFANVSTVATWTAYYDGVLVPLDKSMTKQTIIFTRKESASLINYPLAVSPNAFVAGRTYTFRLSAYPVNNPALLAKTEVVLTVNSPPIGGKTSVSPQKGFAFETDFTITSTRWSDDISDYPLSYSFFYQLADSTFTPALTLAVRSPLPYAVSFLPPGLKGGHGQSEIVTVLGFVYDILNAASQASYAVNVVRNKQLNFTTFLQSSLKQSYELGDTNKIFQTINSVSSAISIRDCSASPNCTALNRYGCLETANTCSSCLTGYKGITGDSNTKCVRESSPIGTIGSVCKQDEDCLYSQCENRLCTAPRQTCQTNAPGTVCSGYGKCESMDSSGNAVQNCTIINTQCIASCSCQAGHGGADCSLNSTALEERSNLRVAMCSALTHVISVSQKSPQLFDSIAGSLLSAYVDTEISGTSELLKCSSVLRFLGTLAPRGFMKGTLPATQQIYAEISSQFVGTRVSPSSVGAYQFADDVGTAVTGMTEGIMRGMSKGQLPVSIVTRNIRTTIVNQLVSSLSNAHFSPPPTAAERNYGMLQPKLLIAADGVSSCSADGLYAQVSTLQFGTNPHRSSEAIKSPLLQFTSSMNMKTLLHAKSSSSSSSSSFEGNTDVEAYYVILQYLSEQKLDLSIQAGPYSRNSNVTIPICTLYDATIGKYVNCGDCSISSYTNYNVTFACYNIKNLCPSPSTIGRRLDTLESGPENQDENNNSWNQSAEDEMNELLSLLINEGGERGSVEEDSSDISILSADDGPSGPDHTSDDLFDSSRSASVSEFGTMLDAIGAELASILSINPFAIDLDKAIPVLSLVGGLCGLILIGLLYFLRWDKMDRHKAVYLLDEKERKIKNQIADDLKKGGNGVTFTTISKKDIKKEVKKETNKRLSFIEIFNSSMTLLSDSDDDYRGSDVSIKSNHSTVDDSTEEEEWFGSSKLETRILIAQFSNHVLPKYYTSNERLLTLKKGRYKFMSTLWKDAFSTIRRNHYITAMYYGSSLRISRTLRFFIMCRKMLLFLFINTLVFSVYFPSDASCTSHKTNATCVALPSKVVVDSSLCSWNSSTGCSITPPPKSMTFVLLTSFIITIFVIVADCFVGYIQSEVAAKRPRLELWGISANSWLGSVHHRKQRDRTLVSAAATSPRKYQISEEEKMFGMDDLQVRHVSEVLKVREDESDFIAREIFKNSLTPRVECIRLMTRVEEFLVGDDCPSDECDVSKDTGGLNNDHLAAVKAISSQLMVNFDGTMKPITFRQKLFYKDRQDLIEKKLANAREEADKLYKGIVGLQVDDDNLKDMVLVRNFILEQVSIFYRFALNKSFANFDGAPPEYVNPGPWLAAWVSIVFVNLFFVYWFFAWCLTNSGGTLETWGMDYGVTLVQDIFICEVAKVCIMYVFAIMSVRPQLQVIKRVINDRALSLAQEDAEFNSEVSIVQHFSPSCRAARMSGLYRLPASAILRSVTDGDVEKCKEHKHFTLGSLIFYIIMVAAVVAIVSEVLMDQMLSSILSALWLVFLLVHTRLVVISPLLLISIYGVIVGAALYHVFVFAPSVERARQARAQSAVSVGDFTRKRSRTINVKRTKNIIRGLVHCGAKLCDHIFENIGRFHTALLFDGLKQKSQKQTLETLAWCDMNRPHVDHGRIVSPSEAIIISHSPGSLFSAGKMGRRLKNYMIPPRILMMRQSGAAFQRDEDVTIKVNILTSRILSQAAFPPIDRTDPSIPAVQLPRIEGKIARKFRANIEITTNPQVALKRMLQRHLLGAESYRNGEECTVFDLHDAVSEYICMSELTEMLSWIWGTFYPGGKELSSELKLEVDDLFQKWRSSPSRLVLCTMSNIEAVTCFNWAHFSEFSAWFLQICSHIDLVSAPYRQEEEEEREDEEEDEVEESFLRCARPASTSSNFDY